MRYVELYGAVEALADPEDKLSCIPEGPERDELQLAYDVIRLAGGGTFGMALEHLQAGRRVARRGWNGKGMWLALVKPSDNGVYLAKGLLYRGSAYFGTGTTEAKEHATPLLPWIGLRTADGAFVPWTPSQTDVLSDDWEVVA